LLRLTVGRAFQPDEGRTGLVRQVNVLRMVGYTTVCFVRYQGRGVATPMSGPIVRSGPSPEFSRNWESVFGKKSGHGTKSGHNTTAVTKKPAKKTAAKAAKRPAGKKAKKSDK
jgi:hypothetical protein